MRARSGFSASLAHRRQGRLRPRWEARLPPAPAYWRTVLVTSQKISSKLTPRQFAEGLQRWGRLWVDLMPTGYYLDPTRSPEIAALACPHE